MISVKDGILFLLPRRNNLKEQLYDFSPLIKENFPTSVTQNTKLQEKLEFLGNRQNIWLSEIVKVYRERKPPLYTSEDIIRLNVQNVAEVQTINIGCVKKQKGLEKQINDCRIKIERFNSELSIAIEASQANISLVDEQLATYVRRPDAIPVVGHDKHPLMLQCKKHAATKTIRAANARINTDMQNVKRNILKNDTHLTGHHP